MKYSSVCTYQNHFVSFNMRSTIRYYFHEWMSRNNFFSVRLYLYQYYIMLPVVLLAIILTLKIKRQMPFVKKIYQLTFIVEIHMVEPTLIVYVLLTKNIFIPLPRNTRWFFVSPRHKKLWKCTRVIHTNTSFISDDNLPHSDRLLDHQQTSLIYKVRTHISTLQKHTIIIYVHPNLRIILKWAKRISHPNLPRTSSCKI